MPFYFCWTCNIAQNKFYYKVLENSKIEILKYEKGGVEKSFPYKKYPVYFPERYISLKKISKEEQMILKGLNNEDFDYYETRKENKSITMPQHQICGEPLLMQSEFDELNCPVCLKRMPFLASVSDNCADKRGFTGNDYVQVIYYYCGGCFILGTLQQCD